MPFNILITMCILNIEMEFKIQETKSKSHLMFCARLAEHGNKTISDWDKEREKIMNK